MCCVVISTTGTTTPSLQTTPTDPCAASVVGRKYGSEESASAQKAVVSDQDAVASNQEARMIPAWALPLLGIVTALAFCTFVVARARWGQRSTRQLNLTQDAELGGTPFVSNDLE